MVSANRILLLVFFSLVSGCGLLNSVWNAQSPKREVVTLKSAPLPAFSRIFSRDEQIALPTLNAWRIGILNSFNQIEGAEKRRLSREEVRVLVKSGLVKLDPDPRQSEERAMGILEILGFRNGIQAESLESLFDWIFLNRAESRTFYELFISESFHFSEVRPKEIIEILNLLGSFLILGGDESVTSKQLAELILPWIPKIYPHARLALESGVEMGISFFSSFCGDRVDPVRWNGKRIGLCLHELTHKFKSTLPGFDFALGMRNPLENPEQIRDSAYSIEFLTAQWISGHHHPLFPTLRIEQFAKALSIPPPYDFLKMTEWMPKLNSDSTPEGLSPSFFVDLATLMRKWIIDTLNATRNESCPLGSHWKKCEFTGKHPQSDQLFNGEYATLVRKKTLGFISKVSFYDAVSHFMFEKLNIAQDGELKSKIKNLINILIRLLDSSAFTQNVIAGILERPLSPSNVEDSLKSHTREGLGELAALAADLIPDRGNNQRSLMRKLESQLGRAERRMPYSMDPIGLTAFVYVYDLISSLNMDYLNRYGFTVRNEGTLKWIKRRKILETLPRILFDHFPRLYNECVSWGFERTCGVVFDEILPNALSGKDELETYEMDVITLSGILIESLMNRCDRNSDELFTGNPIDGYDEKTCIITIGTAMAKRLMNAGFVEQASKSVFLMYLVNHFFAAKWSAKAALSRGTLSGLGWYSIPMANWFSGPASLGSILSVSAEIMDPEKVRNIENNTEGPIDSDGDELIYHHRLTDYHLPSIKIAPRFLKN